MDTSHRSEGSKHVADYPSKYRVSSVANLDSLACYGRKLYVWVGRTRSFVVGDYGRSGPILQGNAKGLKTCVAYRGFFCNIGIGRNLGNTIVVIS